MQAPTFQNARFLIVDDESQNINVLTQMLQQWDATHIVSTTDPHQTISLLCSFQPDVILLDLRMPELDGFAVMEQLKSFIARDDFLPIVVLTADPSHLVKRRALLKGA